MTPERSKIINGHLVEEYYWCGGMVVYIDHHNVNLDFESACAKLENENEKKNV